MTIDELFEQLFVRKTGTAFYTFSNSVGQQWWLPEDDVRVGLNLFQPSRFKGKLLKLLFPYIRRLPFLSALHIRKEQLIGCEKLRNTLSEIFGVPNLTMSIFGGSPCSHQKITIQLSKNHELIGYCKVSDRADVRLIFHHEQQVLNELALKNITQIPQCLFCGHLEDDIELFVQSTIKTAHSKTTIKWSDLHWKFLHLLHQRTSRKLCFEQTDFCRILENFKTLLPSVSPDVAAVIREAIEKIRCRYAGKKVLFSLYHADFTPWNTFVEKGELFVFDFEYAQFTYPPYLDYFHFITQSGIFDKQMDAKQLYGAHSRNRTALRVYFDDPDFSYLCYLVGVIHFLLEREPDGLNAVTSNKFHIWIDLIREINTHKTNSAL